MSKPVPDAYQRCLSANKTALVFVSTEGTEWPVSLDDENLGARYFNIIRALHEKGIVVLPHNVTSPNSSRDGYDSPYPNDLYPATRLLEAGKPAAGGGAETSERGSGNGGANSNPENADWSAILATVTEKLHKPDLDQVGVTECNGAIWCDMRPLSTNCIPCQTILRAEVARLNDDASYTKFALRRYHLGHVIELTKVLGTGRTIANNLVNLAEHKGKTINAYCREDIGCVISIASDANTTIHFDRQVLRALTNDEWQIGYSYHVAPSGANNGTIPTNVDEVLLGVSDVLLLLERLAQTVPDQRASGNEA